MDHNLPPLTDLTLWEILRNEIPDALVCALVWHALGYRQTDLGWDTQDVTTTWQQEYPTPPNFIESRPATIKLTRSIPTEDKQLLKEVLGFKGYTVDELTPQRTRRATCVNWLLSYRKNAQRADHSKD